MTGFDIALTKIGLQEKKDKNELMKFFLDNHISCDPSTTPWCAAFMNSCERASGKPGTGSLAARSFSNYGEELDCWDNAKEGDIVVFDFEGDGVHGHVTYFVKWQDESSTIECLGGNQADEVKYSSYPQNKIINIRRS